VLAGSLRQELLGQSGVLERTVARRSSQRERVGRELKERAGREARMWVVEPAQDGVQLVEIPVGLDSIEQELACRAAIAVTEFVGSSA
jgi:hypothetical protein